MQMVSEVMTRDVQFVSPQETLQRAAQLMKDLDVGALPVCEGDSLLGMITDRDITIRATAAGLSPQECTVDQIMTSDVCWAFEDQPLDEVMEQMADAQIRRIPVVTNDEQRKLVGIIALGDLVTKAGSGQMRDDVDDVVEMVSTPSNGASQGQGQMSMQSGSAGSQSGARSGNNLQGGGGNQQMQSGGLGSQSGQQGSQQSGQKGSKQSGQQGSKQSATGSQFGQGMDGELDMGDGTGGNLNGDQGGSDRSS